MDSVSKFGYYESYVACGGYQKLGVLDGEDVFACRQFPVLLYNLWKIDDGFVFVPYSLTVLTHDYERCLKCCRK